MDLGATPPHPLIPTPIVEIKIERPRTPHHDETIPAFTMPPHRTEAIESCTAQDTQRSERNHLQLALPHQCTVMLYR